MSTTSPSFESFAAEVAEIAGCEVGAISKDSLLVGDLGFDSLGFAQLAVLLVDHYGGEAFASALGQIEWESLSAGAVFENYVVRWTGPGGANG